jgi:hypothetical protein
MDSTVPGGPAGCGLAAVPARTDRPGNSELPPKTILIPSRMELILIATPALKPVQGESK